MPALQSGVDCARERACPLPALLPGVEGREVKRKDLYMGTTAIDPLKTIGQIHAYLVRMGAQRIMNTYENGEAVAVHFMLAIGGTEMSFELPARIDPIFKIINKDRPWGHSKQADLDQAKRVAWRQIYRWIQAQVALIETGMAEAAEVFMPYMQVADAAGQPTTLYRRAISGGMGQLALTTGEAVKRG